LRTSNAQQSRFSLPGFVLSLRCSDKLLNLDPQVRGLARKTIEPGDYALQRELEMRAATYD
jgi:hypothetical protein